MPTELGRLSALTDFELQWAPNLSGSIPTELGALTSLRMLVISGCSLSGTIPQAVTLLTALTQLTIADSPAISGSLPAGLSKLTALTAFDVHGMSTGNNVLLDGQGLCALPLLTSCNLGGQLTCPLPATCNNANGNPCLFGASSSLHLAATNSKYISVPANTWFSSGQFTIEAWVYVSSYTSWSRILDFSSGGQSNNNIVFAISDGTTGRPVLQIFNGSNPGNLLVGPVIPQSTWTHIAVTVDTGGNYKMFINGELLAVLFSQLLPFAGNFVSNYIGRSNWPQDGYFDGLIDNFMLWSVCRSPSQIWSSYMGASFTGSEAGLQLYYKFDESSVYTCFASNACVSTGASFMATVNDCNLGYYFQANSPVGTCTGGNVTTLVPTSEPTAEVAACYNAVYSGFDCGLNDLPSQPSHVYTVGECAQHCDSTVGCVGFAITLPIDSSSNSNLCYAKSSIVASAQNPYRQCYVLGVCTTAPSAMPSIEPTIEPSSYPSMEPSSYPSIRPSSLPSTWPSSQPSTRPSSSPSAQPSSYPSAQPSFLPTNRPSSYPSTSIPTISPVTNVPSTAPSGSPATSVPSSLPSASVTPSISPTTSVPSNYVISYLIPSALFYL